MKRGAFLEEITEPSRLDPFVEGGKPIAAVEEALPALWLAPPERVPTGFVLGSGRAVVESTGICGALGRPQHHDHRRVSSLPRRYDALVVRYGGHTTLVEQKWQAFKNDNPARQKQRRSEHLRHRTLRAGAGGPTGLFEAIPY